MQHSSLGTSLHLAVEAICHGLLVPTIRLKLGDLLCVAPHLCLDRPPLCTGQIFPFVELFRNSAVKELLGCRVEIGALPPLLLASVRRLPVMPAESRTSVASHSLLSPPLTIHIEMPSSCCCCCCWAGGGIVIA